MRLSNLSDNQRRIVRFVLAITTGFTVAQLLNWQLSYMAPILLSMIMTGPNIDLKTGALFFGVIVGGSLLGMVLSMTVVNYPLVCLLVLTLLLMNIYIAGNNGASPFAVIMAIMGVSIIPLIGLPSINLSVLLVQSLMTSGLIAVFIAMVFFTLIPTTDSPATQQNKGGQVLSSEKAGVISTLVMLPLLTYFYSFSATNAIVVLVFAAILAQNVDLATTRKGGAVLVLANALGGLCAVVIYNLLVIAPQWPFMVALVALAATYFAGKIFSGAPTAPIYSTAFTAVLLLVGSSLSSDNKDAADAFASRIIQIFLAAAYVVIAFTLLKKLSGYLNRNDQNQPGRTKDTNAETGIIADITP